MTFQTAFGSGDKTKMRSASYSSDYLVKLCSNRIVFAARLNGAVSASFAQVTYNNVTVGAYTDIVPGQVVLIGDTSDIKLARRRGRVRLAPTSSILYINEISDQFSDQAYIWVIDTFDAQYVLSRPDASGNELIDYNLAYQGMQPAVTGLQTAYANYDPAGGNYRIAFSVSAFAKQSGGTISSYAWTFKAGTYTVISGSLSAAAVTVDISPSEQWGKLVVTDNAGVTTTRHFLIQACDNSLNPPDTAISPMQITGDLSRGWTTSLEAFSGVDSVLNQTFAVVFRYNEQYGGTAGGLSAGNNIAFCGWLQRETDPVSVDRDASVIETATFEFNGVAAALARLNSQLVPFYDSTSPSAWGYIKALTPWRAVGHYLDRYTTIGSLCDIAYDDNVDTYKFPTITTQGGNALEVIRGIAAMVGSVIEFAPDGRIQMVKDATYQNSTQRGNDPIIMDFQDQDCISVTRTVEPSKTYGLTDTDGAYLNTGLSKAVGFTARAPGVAREEAQGSDNLPSQILAAAANDADALAELLQRVANRFEYVNNSEYLDVEFPDGYNWIIPSRQQLYTFTLSSLTPSGVNRISYTSSTYWLCEQVTISRGDNGVTQVRAKFHMLQRIGQGAINTTLTAPGTDPILLPDYGLPAFGFEDPIIDDAGGISLPAVPPNPTAADRTGQFLVVKNASAAWIQKNFIDLTTPISVFVTPSDLGAFSITQVLLNPFSPDTSPGCYLLAYDSARDKSAVWYTANIMDSPPVWTKGAEQTGQYNVIRTTATPGVIAMYGAAVGTSTGWTFTLDFTAVNYTGQYALNYNAQGGAIAGYSAGNGWGGLGVYRVFVSPTASGDATTFTSFLSCTYHLENPSGSGYFDVQFSGVGGDRRDPGLTGDYTYSTAYVNGPYNPYVLPQAFGNFFGPNYPGNNYVVYLKSVTYQGTGTTPTLS